MKLKKIAAKLHAAADLQYQAALQIKGRTQITLDGDRWVLIEGHRGILDYEDARILIAGKERNIAVEGQQLSLSAMDADRICIRGLIRRIEYRG